MVKKNDLNSMIFSLNLAEKCVPSDLGVKRVWFKGLASLRRAVTLQREVCSIRHEKGE